MLRKIMIMILLILTVVWFTNSDSIQPAREFIQNNIYVWSEMQEEKLPIYCVDTQKKQIALTFDTAWGNEDIPQILKILKQENVKATFFLVGENAESNEKVVKRMYEEGHLIGNHTYSHIKLDECNISSAVGEINKTNEIIKSITGEDVKYIRPPYGAYSDKLLSHVNMTPVLWSIDPDDWATTDTAYVVKSVVYKVKNGDIILLHDIYDSSVEAALEIIDRLSSKGFVFVTVDQLMLD